MVENAVMIAKRYIEEPDYTEIVEKQDFGLLKLVAYENDDAEGAVIWIDPETNIPLYVVEYGAFDFEKVKDCVDSYWSIIRGMTNTIGKRPYANRAQVLDALEPLLPPSIQ